MLTSSQITQADAIAATKAKVGLLRLTRASEAALGFFLTMAVRPAHVGTFTPEEREEMVNEALLISLSYTYEWLDLHRVSHTYRPADREGNR